MRTTRQLAAATAAAACVIPVLPDLAAAHALIGRKNLPVPPWLFAWAASLVLVISFALLSVAWKRVRLQSEEWRPLPRSFSRILVNPATELLCGLIGVALLVLVIYAGFNGTLDATRNFAVVFTFYTFWLGLIVLGVLLGDVFRAFNPWRAVGRTFSAGFRLIAGQSASAPFRYPDALGRWPGAAVIVAFVWMELLANGGFAPNPEWVAEAAAIYSVITFVCMALFGADQWIDRGEAFNAYFGMFARLSVFEVRDGVLGHRRFLSGAPQWAAVPGTAALVLTSIAVTSFDGAQAGALYGATSWTYNRFVDLGLSEVNAYRVANSIWLAIVIAGVAALYWIGIRGMHTVRGSPPIRRLGGSFAHTLIPIALAYLVAHYFSAFVYQEQAQFTYVLSDPLGNGSDLFGTASGTIDYGLFGSATVWYVQVAALVAGHVAGLILAHDRALAVYDNVERATRSQYFMLAVMVGFTCFGLYLLSQANV